jgi:hypothetical protein
VVFGDDSAALGQLYFLPVLRFFPCIAPHSFIHESGESVGFPITAVSRKWKQSEKADLCRSAATVIRHYVQCSDELAVGGVVCFSFSFLFTCYQIIAK